MQTFYSHGKLLLTAEYAVLKGAKALAIPCQKGQILKVKANSDNFITWESFDINNEVWFKANISLPSLSIVESTDIIAAKKLVEILKCAKKQNEKFLKNEGVNVQTYLEFDRNWGLGSSSTLISNIALWANVNAYKLLEESFGGSGYDLACAQSETPIFYTREGLCPVIERISFDPLFKQNLFFVYLNKKKSSLAAINALNWELIDKKLIDKINAITEKISVCNHQDDFNKLLLEHEENTGSLLGETPVQKLLFPDFNGAIKSLGAWGGDFILASGDQDTTQYFHEKGFTTVIRYSEMIYKA